MQYKCVLPFLFINLNILSILDKFITILALKNVLASEANPIITSTINIYGITNSLIMYMIISFVWTTIIYTIVIHYESRMKRFCSYTTPENFFLLLNIYFYFVLLNNIYQIIHSGGL